MKARLLSLIFFMISSMCIINAQRVYDPASSLDEAKKYFAERINDLDPVEGVYKGHLDIKIDNPYTGGGRDSHDFYFFIFDPKKAENYNWDFVWVMINGGNLNVWADVKKKGSVYSFEELDYAKRVCKVEFQMIRPDYFTYYRYEGRDRGGYTTSERTTTATKIYPTHEMYQAARYKEQAKNAASSGTGFLINNQGYILTNYHVIENAKNGNIKITGLNDDYNTKVKAVVEVTDKQNDLAILKISSYSNLSVPYAFKFNTANVGEDCFVLGYPLISSMGKDIKITNGIISSKTGFDGNIAQYQISAPVQPGNSGGPLFDKDGNVIGIVQAKHREAENAGYAIKSSYIRNLVELLPITISFPTNNLLKGKSLPQQVNLASKAVCIVIVNEN